MTHRPRIALIGRFSTSASALRHRGVVGARALLESVWRAGGDPVLLYPAGDLGAGDWDQRLIGISGVLFPGGGDMDPSSYGQPLLSEHIYDVDRVQDQQDLSLARYVLDQATPFLAVCRGMHVMNVALGGTLQQHIEPTHRHYVHEVKFEHDLLRFGVIANQLICSCYHHQAIQKLGEGLEIVARANDGIAEALVVKNSDRGICVQWHPEDTAETDPNQQAIFDSFVDRCR